MSQNLEYARHLASPFQSPTNADRSRERPRAPNIEEENNRRPDIGAETHRIVQRHIGAIHAVPAS